MHKLFSILCLLIASAPVACDPDVDNDVDNDVEFRMGDNVIGEWIDGDFQDETRTWSFVYNGVETPTYTTGMTTPVIDQNNPFAHLAPPPVPEFTITAIANMDLDPLSLNEAEALAATAWTAGCSRLATLGSDPESTNDAAMWLLESPYWIVDPAPDEGEEDTE